MYSWTGYLLWKAAMCLQSWLEMYTCANHHHHGHKSPHTHFRLQWQCFWFCLRSTCRYISPPAGTGSLCFDHCLFQYPPLSAAIVPSPRSWWRTETMHSLTKNWKLSVLKTLFMTFSLAYSDANGKHAVLVNTEGKDILTAALFYFWIFTSSSALAFAFSIKHWQLTWMRLPSLW